MTPMIDVVFLLLVFFVWTASFQAAEQVLPSHLLSSHGTSEQIDVEPELIDLDQVIIKMTGNIFLNGTGQLAAHQWMGILGQHDGHTNGGQRRETVTGVQNLELVGDTGRRKGSNTQPVAHQMQK